MPPALRAVQRKFRAWKLHQLHPKLQRAAHKTAAQRLFGFYLCLVVQHHLGRRIQNAVGNEQDILHRQTTSSLYGRPLCLSPAFASFKVKVSSAHTAYTAMAIRKTAV